MHGAIIIFSTLWTLKKLISRFFCGINSYWKMKLFKNLNFTNFSRNLEFDFNFFETDLITPLRQFKLSVTFSKTISPNCGSNKNHQNILVFSLIVMILRVVSKQSYVNKCWNSSIYFRRVFYMSFLKYKCRKM